MRVPISRICRIDGGPFFAGVLISTGPHLILLDATTVGVIVEQGQDELQTVRGRLLDDVIECRKDLRCEPRLAIVQRTGILVRAVAEGPGPNDTDSLRSSSG